MSSLLPVGFIALGVAVIVYQFTIGADRRARRYDEFQRTRDVEWLAKVDEWNQSNPPHCGPCQCNGCVIRDDDDSATRWRKAMRRIGVDSRDQP